MKTAFIALAFLGTLSMPVLADTVRTDIDVNKVVEELEKSGLIFAANLEASRNYCKGFGYVETSRQIRQSNALILDLHFGPQNPPQFGTYAVVWIQVYFRLPSTLSRFNGGGDEIDFYRLDTIVNTETIGPRQPGDISSAGGGRK
jgi:hypothetical protein